MARNEYAYYHAIKSLSSVNCKVELTGQIFMNVNNLRLSSNSIYIEPRKHFAFRYTISGYTMDSFCPCPSGFLRWHWYKFSIILVLWNLPQQLRVNWLHASTWNWQYNHNKTKQNKGVHILDNNHITHVSLEEMSYFTDLQRYTFTNVIRSIKMTPLRVRHIMTFQITSRPTVCWTNW